MSDLCHFDASELVEGELYLFNTRDAACPPDFSLWGIVSCVKQGAIILESSTRDNRLFNLWHVLPEDYIYCRLSTRSELYLYASNLSYFESL